MNIRISLRNDIYLEKHQKYAEFLKKYFSGA